MKILLFGELQQEKSDYLNSLLQADHTLTQIKESEHAREFISEKKPDIILLANVSEESRKLAEFTRELPDGDQYTLIVFANPDEAEHLFALRDAGVDECILESLHNIDRLRIRLAFVLRMAREKIRRSRSEKELENRVQQQKVLSDLAQKALIYSDPDELYQEMLEAIVKTTSQQYGILLRKHKVDLKMLALAGLNHQDIESLESSIKDDPLHNWVLQHGEPQVISQNNTARRQAGLDSCWRDDLCSVTVLPLPGQKEPLGVLSVCGSQPHEHSDDELRFLETAASMFSGVINRVESETKSKTILDTTIDGIITIDENGYIESYNPAAERLFGYSTEEVIGEKVNMLMPEPYRSEHDNYLENYKRTGERKIIGIGREVTGLNKSGSTFPMYLAVNEMKFNGRRMFTGIVSDISQQRELEQELLQSGEHERRRIGQDLHDGLGQMLSGIGMMTRQLAKSLENEEHRMAEKAQEISGFIKEADQYARQLSRGLMPVDIDSRGLATAFTRLIDNAGRMFQVNSRFHENNTPVFEDNSTVEQIYRIGQEAVTNAVKHGNASEVDLILDANDEYVTLEVHDNGKGFPKNWREHAGMGMKILQFRARLVGGTLEVYDRESGGTILRCTIPKKESRYYLEG